MVVIPDVIYRVSLGMLEGSLNPMLCHITDVRHNSQYGLINGFYASSYNLALGVGKCQNKNTAYEQKYHCFLHFSIKYPK